MDNLTTINTHPGPETRLSRIGIYRLKQALLRRDEAIQKANQQYADEVDAIFAAETRKDPQPAIANPGRWPWLVDLRALASEVRRG